MHTLRLSVLLLFNQNYDLGGTDWLGLRIHLFLELCYAYDLPLNAGDKHLSVCCQGVPLTFSGIAKAAITDD